MSKDTGYGQYCPIALAAEVLAERWTPLVLRAFFCGATRFSEVQASVPRMSSALLSRRLKELQHAGIITAEPTPGGRGFDYRLTEAGRELFPVLDRMGHWAQKWLRREITEDRNLDPDILMWDLRQSYTAACKRVDGRKVVQFHLDGVPVAKRFYWLVFENDETDVCVMDPGYEVDLWVRSRIRTLVEIRLGHRGMAAAIEAGLVSVDGDRAAATLLADLFAASHFGQAEIARRSGAAPTLYLAPFHPAPGLAPTGKEPVSQSKRSRSSTG